MDRVVTGREISVTMTLDFTGDELEAVGSAPWEIPDRIVKALTKPEVQRVLVDAVRKPRPRCHRTRRLYGEEDA